MLHNALVDAVMSCGQVPGKGEERLLRAHLTLHSVSCLTLSGTSWQEDTQTLRLDLRGSPQGSPVGTLDPVQRHGILRQKSVIEVVVHYLPPLSETTASSKPCYLLSCVTGTSLSDNVFTSCGTFKTPQRRIPKAFLNTSLVSGVLSVGTSAW